MSIKAMKSSQTPEKKPMRSVTEWEAEICWWFLHGVKFLVISPGRCVPRCGFPQMKFSEEKGGWNCGTCRSEVIGTGDNEQIVSDEKG